MNEKELKEMIIEIGNLLVEEELTSGTGGNISGRLPGADWFYITPSGIPYSEITNEDFVKINLQGKIIEGNRRPSIEHNMHLKIFQNRDDINAVVHTHSFYAKTVAVVRKDIPPIMDIIALMFGGPIEVTKYGRPGSIKLAENVSEKLRVKNGVIIANHGAIGIGKDFKQALKYCNIIEEASKVFLFANILGNPIPLTEEEIQEDLEFFKNHYGQK